jgi:hypothetical protein
MDKIINRAVIRYYHDYIAMNLHEIVLDPTPEDCDRILRESVCELVVDIEEKL